MLFLQLQIGDDAYAIAAVGVVEVLPLVQLKRERGAPPGIAGTFEYRGRFVAVVDLCAIELGRPARMRLGTRIIMILLDAPEPVFVGLIAENVTDILRCDPADFAPFAKGSRGLTQRIEVVDLLPPALRDHLIASAGDEP